MPDLHHENNPFSHPGPKKRVRRITLSPCLTQFGCIFLLFFSLFLPVAELSLCSRGSSRQSFQNHSNQRSPRRPASVRQSVKCRRLLLQPWRATGARGRTGALVFVTQKKNPHVHSPRQRGSIRLLSPSPADTGVHFPDRVRIKRRRQSLVSFFLFIK